MAEDPNLPELQSFYWNNYQKKKFLDLILTCLAKACSMAHCNRDILGLRVHITKTLATLELEMKKSLYC